jgi:uncharacterized membrane protein
MTLTLEECMNQRRVHQIFEIGVLLKGAHALIKCIGGYRNNRCQPITMPLTEIINPSRDSSHTTVSHAGR